MNASLTIEQFNTLLQSDKDNNSLMMVLRQLLKVEKPEDVVKATDGPLSWWWGWG